MHLLINRFHFYGKNFKQCGFSYHKYRVIIFRGPKVSNKTENPRKKYIIGRMNYYFLVQGWYGLTLGEYINNFYKFQYIIDKMQQ